MNIFYINIKIMAQCKYRQDYLIMSIFNLRIKYLKKKTICKYSKILYMSDKIQRAVYLIEYIQENMNNVSLKIRMSDNDDIIMYIGLRNFE